MLQQILKDMYIDPDVLEALNEDQKKTLFLKMRQEQVRRWKEREEKLERDGGDAKIAKPKKANSKNVSWLLGRDGDVAVLVIGEVDELSSRFICSGLAEKKSPPSLQNNTYHQTILKSRTEPVRAEIENLPPKSHPGISLNLKGKSEETSALLPLPVSVSTHPSPPAAEKLKSTSGSVEKPLIQPTTTTTTTNICSRPPMRASPVNVRPASANPTPGSINSGAAISGLKTTLSASSSSASSSSASPSSTVKVDSGVTSPIRGLQRSQDSKKIQDTQAGKDSVSSELPRRAPSEDAATSGTAPVCAGRGRVAQLMKTFSVDSGASPSHTPPRGVKPPLPTKPNHLRLTTTPTVR